MYAKIFTQIFDSSIAENYEVRHVFEDLLKLADVDGVVDITAHAIARRTNVPIEKVEFAINELMKPEPESRSKEEGGRRLVLIDSGRTWGWKIVNYHHYRELKDSVVKRQYFRDYQRKYREEKKKSKRIRSRSGPVAEPGLRAFCENEGNPEAQDKVMDAYYGEDGKLRETPAEYGKGANE